jgi:hypothetical protein
LVKARNTLNHFETMYVANKLACCPSLYDSFPKGAECQLKMETSDSGS